MSEEVLLTSSRFTVARVKRTDQTGYTHEREVIRHPGSVVILPIVDDDHVCLIRNYRIAVGKTLIELPAGTLERGEDPDDCAGRELIEETGYRAGQIEPATAFWAAPGILDEKMHLYVATGLVEGNPAREPGEEIDNLVTPWRQALEWVMDGTISDAKTIVGLLWYQRSRSRE